MKKTNEIRLNGGLIAT